MFVYASLLHLKQQVLVRVKWMVGAFYWLRDVEAQVEGWASAGT